MKNLLPLIAVMAFMCNSLAQTSGGPDAFGYVWRDSNDPNGPSFDWVDITSVGTAVTGLTDDNASQFIPMDGMSFHYYWTDITKLIIGSNGWIGFSNTSNIAHCFPTLPTGGGAADHYLAPMMTDLLISQPGFNADVYYYYDQPNDRFIVSYIDAPWWNVNSPGYVGSNTFQVVLAGQDSSITFQYLDVDQANLTDQTNCAQDLVIGIENLTGDIGLQVYQEVVPADNYAIKFYYPNPVTFTIQDAGPGWNQNVDSKGQFVLANTDFNLQTGIANFGNTDIATEIEITGTLANLNNALVYTGLDTLSSLSAGANNTVVFSDPANLSPGQYYYRTETDNPDDINPSNDVSTSEINAVDMSQSDFTLSYATQNPPLGSVLWQGGDGGVGVYFKPPSYPVTLDSVGVYIADFGGAQNFRIEVYDDDLGPDIPGTNIATEIVSGSSYITNSWVNVPLSSPIVITEGGVFIGWIHITNSTVALGTEQSGPISRQSYEYIGGNWAVYRENDNTELLINGYFTTECGSFTVNTDAINHASCFGEEDGSIEVTASGGSTPYSYSWDNALGSVEDPDDLGAGIYVLTVTDDAGCTTGTTITLNQPSEITGSQVVGAATQGNNGSIDFAPAGGTPPYTYSWSNGYTTQDVTGVSSGTYTVTVTDSEGCEASFDISVPDQLGIEEYERIRLELYPNPNAGEFTVVGEISNDGIFEVLDVTGRSVPFTLDIKVDRAQISLDNPSKGFYLLRYSAEKRIGVQRFTVN